MTFAPLTVTEADIERLHDALETGEVTSVELVARYLNRICHYDRSGIALNSVPVLNPAAFDEARDSDGRRARGQPLGPLDGIPYSADFLATAFGSGSSNGSGAAAASFAAFGLGEETWSSGRGPARSSIRCPARHRGAVDYDDQ
jgi:amidase